MILVVRSLYAVGTVVDLTIFTDENISDMTEGQYTNIQSFLEYVSQQKGYEVTLREFYIMILDETSSYLKTTYLEQDSEVGLDHKESVKSRGGFYIGRYEASYEDGKAVSKKSIDTRTSGYTTLTDGMLWNNISQPDALQKSKEMYPGKSSLLTGAAWERTLGWLEETGAVSSFEIVRNSRTWGNYEDDEFSNTTGLINTGSMSQTEKNHIFDLAGNLWEWTTEANIWDWATEADEWGRVARGRWLLLCRQPCSF